MNFAHLDGFVNFIPVDWTHFDWFKNLTHVERVGLIWTGLSIFGLIWTGLLI